MKDYKPTKLTTNEWLVYTYLKEQFLDNPYRWISKEEIMERIPEVASESKATSHDVCSNLNLIRIRLNRAGAEGQHYNVILLDNNKFKIAANKDEAEKYLHKDKEDGLKKLVRYYENMKILKRDGQGRLMDNQNNLISDEDLNKRFIKTFSVG